ncbi:MAG: VOC family protein [Actinobacteria bacterium]|nr:VOC family protein [Actinomycetota bacterium]MBV9932806.1 VOC family protein [Actinomycetota bacterium]
MDAFSHFGICVSDLDRSLRFYCDGLGFEQTQSHSVGAEFGPLMEVDEPKLESRFITRDGINIELLWFATPGHTGDGQRRPMNQLGLTHLSFRVDDVEGTAARLVELGGRVVEGTRTTFAPTLDFVYCTDPDGVRIELMKLG